MAKKNIVRRARVVAGKRWYIDFTTFDLSTGTETRHRHGFDLDEIPDLTTRREVAERLARYLDTFLPTVAPNPEKITGSCAHTLHTCVVYARDQKASGPRKASGKNYKTIARHLLEWAGARAHEPAALLDKRQARAFRDHLRRQGRYTGRTINNYVNCLRTMWNELREAEMLDANPWAALKPLRESEKRRRTFTADERRTVAQALAADHFYLFRAVLLLYYCFIRPAEMCRLRRRNFDLEAGIIEVESGQAKMWKRRFVTIPRQILPYFQDRQFAGILPTCYVFGHGWKPNSAHPLNPVRLMKAHRAVLEALYKSGKLADIEGLSLYSWKDTGITTHARATSPLATRDQAGHQDLRQTMEYYHADRVNAEYLDIADDLLSKKNPPGQGPEGRK